VPYDRLGRHLEERSSPTLATLPDGSVDRYCTLSAGAVGPLQTRETLGREIKDANRSTFRLQVDSTEPGGQAVNVAKQLHAFGSEVTCYGHLDDPIFDSLPFDTVSMGDPALVYAFNFTDGDVMFVEASSVADWTLADLRAVANLSDVFSVDAICCSNWVSFPEMGPAFQQLASEDLPRVPFVLDPGDIVGSEPADVDSLHQALATLQDTFDVIYNANREEIRATAATLPAPPEDDRDRLAAIRKATGIEAVVMHARTEAVVSTTEGLTTVDNVRIDRPQRHTGGGDRFTGGLGYGLAREWDWELALACGNACAAHYVETGDTGTIDDIIEFIDANTEP
jgi:sugar/nucleoside kinase (ribokinase family)